MLKISTFDTDKIINPVPGGTLATILPSGAKLNKLFSTTKLLKALIPPPFLIIKSGKSKIKIPPVLLCT